MKLPVAFLMLWLFCLPACNGTDNGNGTDAGTDAGVDAGSDSGCPLPPDADCTLAAAAECANIRVGVSAAPVGRPERTVLIREQFNALSPEGELTWKFIHPGPDEWDYEGADLVMDFAAENQMPTTISHFVWDQVTITGTPDWVKEITDADELRTAMREHLTTVTERYGDKITRWNVVNEPLFYFQTYLNENHFYQVLGPDYINQAFQIADEITDAELWINEIFLESDQARADAYVALVANLLGQGVPLDGAGVQGHLFFGEPDFELVDNLLQDLADLGIQVAITELDAPVDIDEPDRLELQAFRMARMFEACLKVPECISVTVWGLDDQQSWLNWLLGEGLSPLLYDEELNPKPSYYAVRDALLAGRP